MTTSYSYLEYLRSLEEELTLPYQNARFKHLLKQTIEEAQRTPGSNLDGLLAKAYVEVRNGLDGGMTHPDFVATLEARFAALRRAASA